MPVLNATSRHEVTFRVNGTEQTVRVENRMLLSDVLRHEIGLTGTHVGCEHGVCGACTVQIDGAPARACLVLAAQAEGMNIRTVEALAAETGRLSVLQQAFRDHHGLQCGFCTPGMIASALEYIEGGGGADRAAIRAHLSGNYCRCTGYHNIVAAIDAAQQVMHGRKPALAPAAE